MLTKEILAEIGEYILKGMSEKEACILADISYKSFLEAKEKDESIRKFLEKMMVKFKFAHMEVIQKNKSEKNSMYLLEKILPDEFGSRPKGSEVPIQNIIKVIVNEIQNGGENDIVTATRGSQAVIENDKPSIIELSSILD